MKLGQEGVEIYGTFNIGDELKRRIVMKVSQEGIEEVKKDPELVEAIKKWLHESKFECPVNYINPGCREGDLCLKIWPDLTSCPCCKYFKAEVTVIAKQIVGEE